MNIKKNFLTCMGLILFLCATSQIAYADKYLILLDSSDDMGREVSGDRILYSAVKEVVRFIDKVDVDMKVGLMVFGHTSDGCEDAELVVPFDKPNPEKAQELLAKLTPVGRRGIVDSIEKALEILEKQGGEKTVIFLLTSGWDECGRREYDVEDAFRKRKVEARLVVVGINVNFRDSDRLKMIASMGKGTYHEVEHPMALGNLLNEIAKGSKASLQVIMKGLDPDVPNAQLRIFDDKQKVILSQSIQGFFSTDLETGSYDIQVSYQGKNYWRRDVFIREDESSEIIFDLEMGVGELKIEILDSESDRMKGNIIIRDELDQVVFEGKNQSAFNVSLPEGTYSAEVTVGMNVEYFDYIEVYQDTIVNFPAIFAIMTGTAEIVINNIDGYPINASISIEDSEGVEVAKSEFTSTYLISLPPGDYSAIVTSTTDQQEVVPFYISEGDNIVVDILIEAPLGSLYIRLVTIDGDSVFGRIKVYDERGREIPHFERESIEDAEFTFDLPVGTYKIVAQAEGVIRTIDGVTVIEGDENIIDIIFPEARD